MTKHEDASPVAFEDLTELEQCETALATMVQALAVAVMPQQPNGKALAAVLLTAFERKDYQKLVTLGAGMSEAILHVRVAAETGGTAH